MDQLLVIFMLLPLLGFIISLVIPKHKEALLSRIAFATAGIQLFLATAFIIVWIIGGSRNLNIKEYVIFSTKNFEFFLDFFFDRVTAVYLVVGSLLTFMVTIYSRYYLHREEGFKRFFNTILFFLFGYNVVIFSGNLETLFIGWEILGISSFLLIAFYRDRYLPVKNAVKVFSIYRIGDVGLILAMWMSHHLWHENITFLKLQNYELVHSHLQGHSLIGIFISLMILISAAAKSAQLPFSSWLPRAMEGPTPSSAIFYGSLSVHIGVFILLRTFPFWEHQLSVRIIIASTGFLTSILAAVTARVQSSVKAQIAYASIAQIGLIFIEVAAGFEVLALIHFAGNAFLRTYQLLVSPSVVTYLIREQFYNFIPRKRTIEDSFPKKLEYSIYILSLKEWNLESFMYRVLWRPLKKLGNLTNIISTKIALLISILVYAIGFTALNFRSVIPAVMLHYLPIILASIGLILVLKSFTERGSVAKSWTMIIASHFWIALAISFNEAFDLTHTFIYLIGVLISGFLGYLAMFRLNTFEANIKLDRFHGHVYEHPKIALAFFLACLGLAGFPITPTFIGEDLIFSHIQSNQIILALFVALSFIVDGLALIRIYARVFLGPHIKNYHTTAYRSS
jgi:NADH-quinone oxidoreductase subunit L